MAYEDIFKNFTKLIQGAILPNIFSPPGVKPTGIGEKVFNAEVAENIYGSSDDFLNRYKQFEKYYHELLADPTNIRASFSNLDVGTMKKIGKIDFSVLTLEARRRAEQYFAGGVLKTDALFSNLGFPTISFPSANPYRMPFKFEVNQDMSHPAQVMLNRMIFNIDPTDTSIQNVRYGTQNLMSSEDIQRNLYQIQEMKKGTLLKGSNVLTLDVETTGLLPGSQVRSISLKKYGEMGQLAESFGYDSPRLGGILVGPQLSDTLSSFISKQEELGDLVRSEDDFLDNITNVFRRIVDAEQVTGHNVGFDIEHMITTASSMKGFSDRKDLQDLIGAFLDKKTKDQNYLIDTLEIGRNYIHEKAQQRIPQGMGAIERGGEYVKRFFSTQSLADITMGGSARYVGVENFAMNTNLLDLMAQEKHAPEIFRTIFRGSHIAETDTLLQDYMLKYIHEGKLDFRNPAARYNYAPQISQEVVDIARKTVFKSKAITSVTNIADPRMLTETALNFVQSSTGLRGMTAVVDAKSFASLGLSGLDKTVSEGYIKFEKGKYRLFTGSDVIDIQQNLAEKHLRSLVRQAMDTSRDIKLGSIGSYNEAEKNIISLGVSFNRSHSMEMMKRALAIGGGDLNVQAYVDNIGNLYRDFSDTLTINQTRAMTRSSSLASQISNLKSNFSAGANSARTAVQDVLSRQLAYSEAMLKSGNKYGFMPLESNIVSNILSTHTSGIARNLYDKAIGGQLEESLISDVTQKMTYAISDEMMDITSQFNIGHFMKQQDLRIMAGAEEAKKILLPFEYFMDITGDRKIGGYMSLAETAKGEMVNLTWQSGRDLSGLTSQEVAGRLYDDFMDENRVRNLLDTSNEKIQEQLASFKIHYGKMGRQEAVKSLAQRIDERGIGYAFVEGETATGLREGLAKAGYDITTDSLDGYVMNILDSVGDAVRTGGAYNVKDILANNAQKALFDADASAANNANAVAGALKQDANLEKQAIRNLKMGRTKSEASTAVEMYHAYKGKAGIAALGATALLGGYYMYKNYKENQLYNETLEQQPYEKSRQLDIYNNYTSQIASRPSYRRDPLVTAGVVGNLDNRKIGHTQMGNNKYNHLYGGV